MLKASDQDILSKFKNGAVRREREEAFEMLLQKYREKMYWHIRRLVIDHDDANDVCQNAFIKIWTNLDKFKENSQLYTWLYRIATNEALTFLNQKKRTEATPIETEDYDLADQFSADPYFDGDSLQIKLQTAIALLPDKQRVVFNLRYYDEMKYEDMAQILDTSVGALKASYHHAAKKVEKYLTEN